MKKTRAKNMSLNDDLLLLMEGWCEANGEDVSSRTEELFRVFLRERGLPVDKPLEEVLRYVAEERAKQAAKEAKKAKRK